MLLVIEGDGEPSYDGSSIGHDSGVPEAVPEYERPRCRSAMRPFSPESREQQRDDVPRVTCCSLHLETFWKKKMMADGSFCKQQPEQSNGHQPPTDIPEESTCSRKGSIILQKKTQFTQTSPNSLKNQ